MNNIQILFIRACKSKEPNKRLNSVYRRFYGKYEYPYIHIANILMNICEQYNLISISKLIDELNPNNDYKYPTEDYWLKVKIVLLYTIRHTGVDKLPLGYIKPRRFRNENL